MAVNTNPSSITIPTLEDHSLETLSQKIERKLEEHVSNAARAFADHDFSEAYRELDSLPPTQLTPPMKQLLRRCRQLKDSEKQIERAWRQFDDGRYRQVIRMLEKIPEQARYGQVNELLERSRIRERIDSVLRTAKECLRIHNFDRAVVVLESVPEPDRGEDFVALWNEAKAKRQQLKELRSEIVRQSEDFDREPTRAACDTLLELLEQVRRLTPGDEQLEAQCQRLQTTRQQLEERDSLLPHAENCFEKYDDQGALDIIKQIAGRLYVGKVAALRTKVTNRLAEVKELTQQILDGIHCERYSEIQDALNRLESLQPHATEKIGRELEPSEYHTFFVRVAERSQSDATLIPLLEQFVRVASFETIVCLIGKQETFLEHYPQSATALSGKLCEMLDDLASCPDHVESRLQTLRTAQQHLDATGTERLSDWESLLEALDEFEQLKPGCVGWLKSIVQSPVTRQLERCGHRIAELADRVLSCGIDRWFCLDRIANGRLDGISGPLRRVKRKISNYLTTSKWNFRPLAAVTVGRAISMAGLLVVATLGQFALSYFFGVGGVSGFVFLTILGSLAIFFYTSASEILE